jgi:BMFP domain-containing protein YqiC
MIRTQNASLQRRVVDLETRFATVAADPSSRDA